MQRKLYINIFESPSICGVPEMDRVRTDVLVILTIWILITLLSLKCLRCPAF